MYEISKLRKISIVLAGLIIALSAFAIVYTGVVAASASQSTESGKSSSPDFSRGFAEVVQAVSPAVVSIDVAFNPKNTNNSHWNFDDYQLWPEFQKYFDKPFRGDFDWRIFPNQPRKKLKRPVPRNGLGSGVIFDKRGYIITNAHVVQSAHLISVAMANGSRYEADLVGIDDLTDLAVLKIDISNDDEAVTLPVAKFGDSDSVQVGEFVIALGSPFGFQQSASLGIISAKYRENVGKFDSTMPLLQTDAAINTGNSGGPLFNASGEVIGINTLIWSLTGSHSGIGFAIPANLVANVAYQLIKNGRVERGQLGVVIRDLTNSMADALKLNSSEGAVVVEVKKDSPADNAGFKAGDIIMKFQGQPIADAKKLAEAVRSTVPGTATEIEILRDGSTMVLDVDLASLGDAELRNVTVAELLESQKVKSKYGVSVQPGDDANDNVGVIISSVAAGSPADEAGLKDGDLIVLFNDSKVESVQGFYATAKEAQNRDNISVVVVRDGTSLLKFLDFS